ncbi:MAG TPA: hypothetical protein VND98_11945 [Solirubrobacterales bacterium]|nr:hypothetical protein [Solirubrobacterales bacterium]
MGARARRKHGREVLLGHIFRAHPFSTSFVMIFKISTLAHGKYGSVLKANLARRSARSAASAESK